MIVVFSTNSSGLALEVAGCMSLHGVVWGILKLTQRSFSVRKIGQVETRTNLT
jgi:hypothetical protein